MLLELTGKLVALCAKRYFDYRPRPPWLDAYIREQLARPLYQGIHWGDRRGNKLPQWHQDRLKEQLRAKWVGNSDPFWWEQ